MWRSLTLKSAKYLYLLPVVLVFVLVTLVLVLRIWSYLRVLVTLRCQFILLGDTDTCVHVNDWPRVAAWQCGGRESNPRPVDRKSSDL